jgi:Chaperone of endosialidase
MTGRVQTLRSSVAGNRPTGRQPGELYVNWADNQLGVVNASSTAQDLLAIPFFSALSSYAIGAFVVYNGQLYCAVAASSPGAFVPANWAVSGPIASTTLPLMNGVAAIGTGATWARSDHVHPTDTTKYDVTNPAGYQTAAQVSATLVANPQGWQTAAQVTASLANYLPLAGGSLSGALSVAGTVSATGGFAYAGNAPMAIWWDGNLLIDVWAGSTNLGNLIRSPPVTSPSFSIGHILYGTGGTCQATISTGTVISWTVSASDIKLKTSITEAAKDALAAICSLKVWEFDLTLPGPDEPAQHWNWGLMAHEIEDIIPSTYIPPPSDEGYASIRQMPVVAALVKAVQQLTARVADLEALEAGQ